MTDSPSASQIERFIEAFYAPPNRISLGDSSLTGDRRRWLEDWLDDLRDPSHPFAVLPFDHGTTATVWVALAFTADDLRELRVGIQSFLGPTYSDFNGLTNPHPLPEIHALLAALVGPNYFTFSTPRDGAGQASVRSSLDLLRSVHRFRPHSRRKFPRPTGRILRDFFWAIRDHDAEGSEDLLAELAATGQVSSLNMVYLQIQRMSALERWAELLSLPGLGDAANARRPVLVTEAIAQAIAEVHISGAVEPPDPSVAIRAFRQSVADPYWPFFKDRGGAKTDAVVLLHTLWAIDQGPNRPLLEELASLPTLDEGRWGSLVRTLRRPRQVEEEGAPSSDPIAQAQRSIAQGAYYGAIEVLEATTASTESAALALAAAFEADTVDAAQRAMNHYELLDDRQRGSMPQTRQFRAVFQAVEIRVASTNSWSEWFRRLADDGALAEDAANGVAVWNPDDLARDGATVADAIASLDGVAVTVFRDALPHILTALEAISPNAPLSGTALVRDSILLQLAVSESLAGGELDLVVELTDGILSAGPETARYCDLLEALNSIVSSESAYRHADALIDLVSLVATFPLRNSDCALRFAVGVADDVASFYDRLTETQYSILSQATTVLGYPIPQRPRTPLSGVTGEADPFERLNAMRIGIYTLARGVGARTKGYLESRYPGIIVETSDAQHSTDELVAMAKGCDVVIVAWRAAKHAATDAIKANRPKDRPTLQAGGKGHSSIVAALYEYLM